MPSNTYHVLPAEKGWALRKAGAHDREIFATQREAIANARKHLTGLSGQIVIHNADGKIRDAVFYKLPRVQSPPKSGTFNAGKIEKAVTSVVLGPHLLPAT